MVPSMTDGIPLVHYPKLTSGPIIDDERWLPANRRPPTHIARTQVLDAARSQVVEAARALDAAERSPQDDLHEWMHAYRVLREAVAALNALTQEAPDA